MAESCLKLTPACRPDGESPNCFSGLSLWIIEESVGMIRTKLFILGKYPYPANPVHCKGEVSEECEGGAIWITSVSEVNEKRYVSKYYLAKTVILASFSLAS